MKKNKLSPQVIFLPFILVFLLPLQSFSQDFPSKPITIYVGYEPGAATDVLTRAFAPEAERLLGVPVVVENKPGGGTSVCAALIASKKPDGYTLGAITTGALTIVPMTSRKMSYDPLKDFTIFFSFTEYQYSLAVQTKSPFKTLPELIEHARKNPGALSFSTPGVGTFGGLCVEHLAKEAKVKFKHVPFKGGMPAYTALLGGHVDMTAGHGSERIFVRQGLMRMLTQFHKQKRDPEFPDVPILKEFGYTDSPGGAAALLLIGPKNLPAPVYSKLESALTQAVHNSPDLRNNMKNIDFPFVFKDRRKWEADLPRYYKELEKFLEELGLVKK